MDRLKGMLGLAAKAGALNIGTNNTLAAIKAGKAIMVLLAADASDNTSKQIKDKSQFRGVELHILPLSMSEFGSAIGKGDCAAAAITDKNFAAFYRRVSDTTILGGN